MREAPAIPSLSPSPFHPLPCPPPLSAYRHGKVALGRMYKVLQGVEPAPEDVTPQCVLDALVTQGLDPSKPGYARQRIVLMKVGAC